VSYPGTAAAVGDARGHQPATGLLAQPGSAVVAPARRAGLRVVFEGFPDRGYRSDGRLAPRGEPGALINDPARVGSRAVSLVRRGGIEAVDGTWTPVESQTLCIHGDSPAAVTTAQAVRAALEAEGIAVRPFIGATGPEPAGR
jgi:UPF0271 protein